MKATWFLAGFLGCIATQVVILLIMNWRENLRHKRLQREIDIWSEFFREFPESPDFIEERQQRVSNRQKRLQ